MERFRELARCVICELLCPRCRLLTAFGEKGRAGATRYRTLTKVTLRLFDTAYRAVREFRPVTQGKVSVYLCGATVQGTPHLGHLRSAVCFDILVGACRAEPPGV